MMNEFILCTVENRNTAHRDFTQSCWQRQIASHGTHKDVPAAGIGNAMQQHAIQIDKFPAPSGPDRIDELSRLLKIGGNIGNHGLHGDLLNQNVGPLL